MKKTYPDRPSVYQIVTDRIIASLREGIIPWEKPWKAPTFAGSSFPRSFVTGKPYRGVNVFLLWGTRFSSPFWLTFKQALELGGNVRKGERGSQIVFYKQLQTRKVKNLRSSRHQGWQPGRRPCPLHPHLLHRL